MRRIKDLLFVLAAVAVAVALVRWRDFAEALR